LARKQGLRLGDALVEIGALNPEDLKEALELQAHARKGSDVEIAIALLSQGRFLGSYTHMHRVFDTSLEGVRAQLAGAEVLMDILEGGLPDPVPLEPLLRPDEEIPQPAAAAAETASLEASSAPPLPSPGPQTPGEAANLRGDELMFDLSLDLEGLTETPTPLPARLPSKAAPEPAAEPVPAEAGSVPAAAGSAPAAAGSVPAAAGSVPAAAGSVPAEAGSEEPAQARVQEEATPRPAPEPEGYPDHLRGWPYLLAVTERHMGHLGRKLLEHEAKGLHTPGMEWTGAQLQELNERLGRSAPLIVGATRARAMTEQIRERLG
jgi:hypothetical protein